MEEIEIWKDVIGYEGLYQVSNLGRVKRVAGKRMGKNGILKNIGESILNPFPNKSRYNYLYVSLSKEKIFKQFRVHRLVAITFIPNPDNLPEVNHLDGDKNNNKISNLEWSTGLDNMKHSFKIGTHKIRKGNDAPNTKLTKEQVDNIRLQLSNGSTGRKLAIQYNISDAMISLIKNNKYWL